MLLCSTSSHHLCPSASECQVKCLIFLSSMLISSLIVIFPDCLLFSIFYTSILLYIYTSLHLYFYTSCLLLFYDAVLHENASAHSRMISFIRLEASYDLLTPVMIFQQQGVIYSSIPLHIYTSIHLYLYTSTHVYLLLSTRL